MSRVGCGLLQFEEVCFWVLRGKYSTNTKCWPNSKVLRGLAVVESAEFVSMYGATLTCRTVSLLFSDRRDLNSTTTWILTYFTYIWRVSFLQAFWCCWRESHHHQLNSRNGGCSCRSGPIQKRPRIFFDLFCWVSIMM